MARPMTLEQLQAALRTAARMDTEDPGFTVAEIQKATGLSDMTVRERIREGLAVGTVTRSQRYIERIDGKRQMTVTFVFHAPPAAKKARKG